MSKVNNIIQELKCLTLLEAAELIKEIENTFGVDASTSSIGMMAVDHNVSQLSIPSEVEEKTEFDLYLDDVPSAEKIAILKVVRSLTGLGLIEAKKKVESAPTILKKAISKDDADSIKKQLEEAGAKVVVK